MCLCVLDVIFFFSGVILNTLAIITILRSTQLRKKLCHFMIMVLSCFDLLMIVVYNSGLLLYIITWLTKNNALHARVKTYWYLTDLSSALSFLTLLVMCFERYLGVHYPIFHRTSITRRRLLILLTILIIPPAILIILSTNDFVISYSAALLIFIVTYIPLFVFFNYKLLKISRKIRRQKVTPTNKKMIINFKNVNTCLLAVACLFLCCIPSGFHVVISFLEEPTASSAKLSIVWAGSFCVMNCSFNSLIFFWKNKVLRVEAMKIMKIVSS